MPHAWEARYVTLRGPEAERVAALWRALPVGEQARCHVPSYGLRFFAAGRLVCQASICWQCNNIWADADGRRFRYEFDATHPRSRELLAACEQAIAGGPMK